MLSEFVFSPVTYQASLLYLLKPGMCEILTAFHALADFPLKLTTCQDEFTAVRFGDIILWEYVSCSYRQILHSLLVLTMPCRSKNKVPFFVQTRILNSLKSITKASWGEALKQQNFCIRYSLISTPEDRKFLIFLYHVQSCPRDGFAKYSPQSFAVIVFSVSKTKTTEPPLMVMQILDYCITGQKRLNVKMLTWLLSDLIFKCFAHNTVLHLSCAIWSENILVEKVFNWVQINPSKHPFWFLPKESPESTQS